MGKVLLIGGSPMIGKSTVARKLAADFEINCMSTDDIGEVLQMVKDINPMAGKYYLDYYKEKNVDELIKDIKIYHKNMESAIRRLVEIHAGWGSSMILEGWALYPQYVKEMQGLNVKAVWLVAEEKLLKSRLELRNDFKTGAIEASENYFLRSCWHNSFILDECKRNACNYIVINGTESVEEIKEKILLITGYEG